jgi:hypothetical protein
MIHALVTRRKVSCVRGVCPTEHITHRTDGFMLVPTEKVSNPSDDISTHFEVLHVAEKYAAELSNTAENLGKRWLMVFTSVEGNDIFRTPRVGGLRAIEDSASNTQDVANNPGPARRLGSGSSEKRAVYPACPQPWQADRWAAYQRPRSIRPSADLRCSYRG